MNPNIIAALIIVSLLVIAVPVLSSMAICAPKWWDQKVAPLFPERVYNKPAPQPKWYFAPFRWLKAVIIFTCVILVGFPGALAIMTGTKYIYAWTTWIERKCPYTPEIDSDDIMSYYGTHAASRDRWENDQSGLFGRLWDAALSRD